MTTRIAGLILACVLVAGCVGPFRQSAGKADTEGEFITRVRNLSDAEDVIEAIASPIRIAYAASDVICADTNGVPSWCGKANLARPAFRELERAAYAVLDEWRRVGESSDAGREQAIISLLRLWRQFGALKRDNGGLF